MVSCGVITHIDQSGNTDITVTLPCFFFSNLAIKFKPYLGCKSKHLKFKDQVDREETFLILIFQFKATMCSETRVLKGFYLQTFIFYKLHCKNQRA